VDPEGHPAAAALKAATGRADWYRLLGSDAVLVDVEFEGRRYGSTSTALVELDAAGARYAFNPRPRDPAGWYLV
jgi:hypothetical protein